MAAPHSVDMMPRKNRMDGKGKIVLVTGATSGMGRLLVKRLLESGYEVRVILRKSPSEHPEWMDLPKGVRVYVADIALTDRETVKELERASKDVSILFHLAAVTYNYRSNYGERVNTNVMIETNVVGTENILQAYSEANKTGRLRLLFASSTAVYGSKRAGETLTEESDPSPNNSYGESKYMAEQVIKAFASANPRLKYTIMRIGVIYGKGYERNFMKVFKLLKEGRLVYVGKGNNHLPLVNVQDVVDGFIDAAGSERSANKYTT